jgi:hypothetical protein
LAASPNWWPILKTAALRPKGPVPLAKERLSRRAPPAELGR